jgi:hypothetical protein
LSANSKAIWKSFKEKVDFDENFEERNRMWLSRKNIYLWE